MAEFKAPYKNDTLKWVVWNADAYADYVNDEVVKAWVNTLDNLVNMWKDTINTVWNFFTWEAEPNLPEWKRMPSADANRLKRPASEQPTGESTEQAWQNGWTQSSWTGTTSTWATWTTWGNKWSSTWWTKTSGSTWTTNTETSLPTFSSKEDVVYYLAKQPWWNSLSEAERVAKVEELWAAQGNSSQDTWKSTSMWEWYSDSVTQNMESDLSNSSEGTLYWKVWWETWWVSSNQDATNVYDIAEQWRIAAVREILTESPSALAAAIYGWTNPYSDQTMRDVRKYAPEYWNTVQAELKKLQTWDNVNAIASWESIKTVADTTDVKNDTVTYAVNNSTQSVSSTNLLKSIDQKLAMNNDASTAESTMDLIAEEMERQKKRLSNLQKEANTVFKWDASQQLVNAYISNKSQEIQNELSILEWRYNAALDRYKLAVSHAERAADYELKKNSLQLDWYKELNKTGTTTTSSGVGSMRTERHNNPTAMTVWWMQWAWIEPDWLYEIWDPFTWSDWRTYYTARLLWDPLDTTIKILNQAIANWHNPFNTGSWSYMNQLWMNIEKRNSMTDDQRKSFIVNDWLPHEWWDITKMAYYAWNNNKSWTSYDISSSKLYDKYLSWDYWEWWLEKTAAAEWQTTAEFANSAKAYQSDLNAWLISSATPWEIKSSYAYELLNLFADLYDIVDKNENWKVNFTLRPSAYSYDIWNQIRSALTLDAMINARENDVWFWSVTEWEWVMLRQKATAIWNAYWTKDKNLDKEFQKMIKALWSKTYWNTDWFSMDTWMDFRKQRKSENSRANPDELIKNTASQWLNSWQSGAWAFTEPTDWNYVNAYWIIW